MSRNDNLKNNKKDSGAKKIKRGAIMTGVVIGMGATFVLSTVINAFSKGAEKIKSKKEKEESEE